MTAITVARGQTNSAGLSLGHQTSEHRHIFSKRQSIIVAAASSHRFRVPPPQVSFLHRFKNVRSQPGRGPLKSKPPRNRRLTTKTKVPNRRIHVEFFLIIPRIVFGTNKQKFQHTLEAETLRHNASNLCRVTYFVFHLAASGLGLPGRFQKIKNKKTKVRNIYPLYRIKERASEQASCRQLVSSTGHQKRHRRRETRTKEPLESRTASLSVPRCTARRWSRSFT